jgi:hypothetical protein
MPPARHLLHGLGRRRRLEDENSGRTWFPISDEGIPIGSIGAIAVAPSNANVVYVGTGEPDIRSQNSYGIGMFKSTDAGKTWTHIGLETRGRSAASWSIHQPNRVYVAALGHIYDANPERGVYRSTDGGATGRKSCSRPAIPNNVGASISPSIPRIRACSTLRCGARGVRHGRSTRRPTCPAADSSSPPTAAIPGSNWRRPATDDFVGKIGIAVSPSNPNRSGPWSTIRQRASRRPWRGGGGASADPAPPPHRRRRLHLRRRRRHLEAGQLREPPVGPRLVLRIQITVDPTNPDRAYVINTATYMTTDAGKTLVPVKGAPGGDDYHQLWVNPKDGNRMVLSSDQGTVVSVDGSKTWSTWYNQPTAQIYHVAADNRFPYWLYGAQQDSGGVGVSTWSREGVLSFRNWEPTCRGRRKQHGLPIRRTATSSTAAARAAAISLNIAAPLGGSCRARSQRSQPQDLDAAAGLLAGR